MTRMGESRPRRYAVSDVHGHLADLRSALRRAGLVDGMDRWTGGSDELWVLGDLLDRGPDGLGVIDLLRDLQRQAPTSVHVLLGNHEALALGAHAWPQGRFGGSWLVNGGQWADQEGLDDDRVAWLRGLPAMGRAGDWLLVHSDTVGYAGWGSTVEEVNAAVTAALASGAEDRVWDVWATLCGRYGFVGNDGEDVVGSLLAAFGGDRLVHGHTIVGVLRHEPSPQVTGPLSYAGGRALAIDGGRYDGGPLLLVALD